MPRKIDLVFSEPRYEYDLYSLCKAFWPDAEIRIRYAEKGKTSDASGLDTGETTAGPEAVGRIDYESENNQLVAASFSFKRMGTQEGADREPVPAELPARRIRFPAAAEQLEKKNHVKALVYTALSEMTGRTLPWGDLTGIRPVKLVSRLLREGRSDAEIAAYMRQAWFVSPEKSALALATAKREQDVLQHWDPGNGISLYIGIPFCPSICGYCSFGSHPLAQWLDRVDAYLEALNKELEAAAALLQDTRIDTVYIGGGTPTTLTPEQMTALLVRIRSLFRIGQLREFTVEAGRPDTITEELLAVLRTYGVNRISVNPQTMNEETLVRIGRKHTAEETRRAFYRARAQGFDNINMDLIVGLPGEGEPEVAHTLREIRALGPDSLTVHSLALKRASGFRMHREGVPEDAFANSDAIMEQTARCAKQMGMEPYYLYRQKQMAGNFENVGYAVPGKEGLYNILIMEQRQSILGFGAGASTKLITGTPEKIVRLENVKDLTHYLERTEEMIERKRAGIQQFLIGETR